MAYLTTPEELEAARKPSSIGNAEGETVPSTGKAQPIENKPQDEAQDAPAPGITLKVKKKPENKTAHIHLMMTPSLHKAGVKAAKRAKVSFNELMTQLLEMYLDQEKGR